VGVEVGNQFRLAPVDAEQGRLASGQVSLNWMAAGLATGHTVRVDISSTDGRTWSRVAGGWPPPWGASSEQFQASLLPLGRWRVQDETETNVVGPVRCLSSCTTVCLYYVNDDSPDDDVYSPAWAARPTAASRRLSNGGCPKSWTNTIWSRRRHLSGYRNY
jgi:hypothetical protein